MAERAAYSRVYWSIIDDPKFESIYDHDAHLAAWLRLLIIADQAWPAPAHLPRGIRETSVKALIGSGLIEIQGTDRYRVHGLNAERARRRLDAERIRGARNERDAMSDAQSVHASSGAQSRAVGETRVDEVRRDKERRGIDEDGRAKRTGLERADAILERASLSNLRP